MTLYAYKQQLALHLTSFIVQQGRTLKQVVVNEIFHHMVDCEMANTVK